MVTATEAGWAAATSPIVTWTGVKEASVVSDGSAGAAPLPHELFALAGVEHLQPDTGCSPGTRVMSSSRRV
ncbi:hypothetical protein [Streptomyces sp. CBG31]|uniref:hypothetical protein n=1 Tax=Streptomyces sp. CBG31 TaxID=2762623 RepID=UPI0037D9C1A2